MNAQLIKELDAAAHIILAPPNHVSSEQRHTAEQIFLNFRKTKMPYQLCRDILETSRMDFVSYEAVKLIKSALVKEWKVLPSDDITALLNYLYDFNVNKQTIAPFVREQISQVIAVIIKRKSVEDDNDFCNIMLNQIESLIISGNLQKQLFGCGLVSALMHEYSTTINTSDVGLTWKIHLEAKMKFEPSGLKRIFKFCVNALSELTNDDIDVTRLPLVKQLFIILESICVWGFLPPFSLPRRMISELESTLEADSNISFHPGIAWEDVILDPMVIEIFFTLYWKIRTDLQIAHHARNCLVQLASLNGQIFNPREKALKYVNRYLENFIKLISNIHIIDQEAVGIAQIIQKILLFHFNHIHSMSLDLRNTFINQMTRLTFLFAEGLAQEESMCREDCLYTEAFEIMLYNWLNTMSYKAWTHEEMIQEKASQIFNLYLKCRLSPPDGNRQINEKELEEEVVDIEEKDRDKYKKQLQVIGAIGRKVPHHSITVLARLLESRAMKLRQELSQIMTSSKNNYNGLSIDIQNLYEDIHWLVLLSGHVLCMESNGESPRIPSEIMRHSMKQCKDEKINMDISLQLFASPQLNFSEINTSEESIDDVIRLTSAILRLCEIEKIVINENMGFILSPELSGTIVWFLQQWCLNYLLPHENDYDEISITIIQAFGSESAGAQWVINYLLEKIQSTIATFMGEEELMKDVIELLLVLVKSRPKFIDRTLIVLKSNRLGHLIELATKNHMNLPQVAKRGLLRAIVEIGVALKDGNEEEQYWSQTLQYLRSRFDQIINMNDFARVLHQENIKIQIIDILDCFIGVAQGVNITTAESVSPYIQPVLFRLPNLLSLCHNYQQIVQLILELLNACTHGILDILDKTETDNILQSFIQTIEVYTRCNINRVSVDTTDEENAYQDIQTLMKLLCELLRKDQLLLIEPSVMLADIFLMGLNAIMPLMTMELLKFPLLCRQYFETISLICAKSPGKVCILRADLLQQLMCSVEMGLTSFGEDITEKCCQIIKSMTRYIHENIPEGRPSHQLMAPFMNLLINLILSRQITVANALSNISSTLYYLICCYQGQYSQLVKDFLATQPNPVIAEKLALGFSILISDVLLNFNAQTKFLQNFEEFIVTVLELTVIE